MVLYCEIILLLSFKNNMAYFTAVHMFNKKLELLLLFNHVGYDVNNSNVVKRMSFHKNSTEGPNIQEKTHNQDSCMELTVRMSLEIADVNAPPASN